MIHIQHVVLSLQPGGLENGVVNVVNRLDPAQFRSSVCCLRQVGEFAGRIRGPGTEVHDMGSRGGTDLMLPLRLARLFRRTATDIVHTRNPEAFYYGFVAAKLAGVKAIVHSEHGRAFDERRIRYWVQRLFSRHIDALFSVTEQLKRDLVAKVGLPEQSVRVLYNGVDFARFGEPDRAGARAALGLSPEQVVVGTVGRLAGVKNYSLLLRAFRRAGNPKSVLVLVGEGPQRLSLEREAGELALGSRVRFLGHREDVPQVLAAIDVFVLPSLHEGMSNTLLEAMACGTAVIASKVGGNPEIVRESVDGLLFPSRDESALARCLAALLEDPARRARFAAAGRERIRREFSIDAMVSRYQDLYREVYASATPAAA